jgi:hypothetical protein
MKQSGKFSQEYMKPMNDMSETENVFCPGFFVVLHPLHVFPSGQSAPRSGAKEKQ